MILINRKKNHGEYYTNHNYSPSEYQQTRNQNRFTIRFDGFVF